MTFAPSDEQQELQLLVRRFCADKSPTTEVRRLMATDDGFDAAVWDQMGKELGLQALHIPEAYGGMGFSVIELGLVMEELGRSLICAPFFSSVVLGATAVMVAGTREDKASLLPAIATGDVRAAVAFSENAESWVPHEVYTVAERDADGFRLTGAKTHVVDGHTAGLLVVSATTPGQEGTSLFVIDADGAPGLARSVLPTLDQTRKLAHIELDGVPARRLGSPGTGSTALTQVLAVAATCLAAEQVGGAAACLEMAVDYAKLRTQFGRPIGSFQAIKHRCADMLVGVESARSAAHAALATAAAGEELALTSSVARAQCSEVFSTTASDTIQIHGGVGFTWEHDAHLHLKRAKSSEALLGGIGHHLDLVADLIMRDRSAGLSTAR